MSTIYKSFKGWVKEMFEGRDVYYSNIDLKNMEHSWNARQVEIDDLKEEIESLKYIISQSISRP